MDARAQRYLADRLDVARTSRPPRDVQSWIATTFANFGGAIESLLAVEAISRDESREWMSRIRAAIETDEPVAVVMPAQTSSGAIAGRGPGRQSASSLATFLGLMPVPDADRSLRFGGRVQILGVERYDTMVAVNWRLAPPPNVDEEFADELALLDRDTEGLPEAERRDRREAFRHRVESRGTRHIGLTDDVGTDYRQGGGNWGGGIDEKVGRTRFTPGIPDSASRLTVNWGELQFAVDVAQPPL